MENIFFFLVIAIVVIIAIMTNKETEKNDGSIPQGNDNNNVKTEKLQQNVENDNNTDINYETVIEKGIIMNNNDLECLKSEYPNINFFINEVEKDPYFNDKVIYYEKYSIDEIVAFFYIGVRMQSMITFLATVESYLCDNYISENSIRLLRLYVKAIILQCVTYAETEHLWKLVKAFVCIYENAKRQSTQSIVNELNQAYASIIELIQSALKNPIVPGMKNPEEILETAEVLLNLYCLFPTTIIEDYLEELVDILEYQRFTSISQKKANEIIVFYKKINCLLFNNGFTNIDKLFKAYSERTPKLDAVTINYFDEKKGTCVISIDFIETPNCNISFLISALDDEKKIIPFDTYANDLHYNIPYVSNSAIECGYVGIKGTIFAFPKQAKFIQVSMNSQKIIREFNLENTEGKDLLVKKLLEGMELNDC